MRPHVRSARARQPLDEFLAAKRSMLADGLLPAEYGMIESTQEALEATSPPPAITLRMTIIWDNDVKNLDLERVLEHMRETGAAFVAKVEQVTS